MVPSVHELAVDLVRRYALTVDDFVVEVGSGDGSLLRAILWAFFKALARLYLFAESYAQNDVLLTANMIVRGRRAP